MLKQPKGGLQQEDLDQMKQVWLQAQLECLKAVGHQKHMTLAAQSAAPLCSKLPKTELSSFF